jgi:Uma2 family endonuclease
MAHALPAELHNYYISPEDYLVGERVSQQKHEYLAGVIYAMAGTSIGHARIADNILRELGNQLRGRPCEAFSSDVKVRIRRDAADFFYYPDVTVDCSGANDRSLFAEEQIAIFEVLSPDTERIDRGEKLRNYQALPSLEVYALVDQFHVAVTVYRRTDEGWVREFLTAKTNVLALPTIEVALPLGTIYERTHL